MEDLSLVVEQDQEILEDQVVVEHTILNPEEQETLHQHHLHKEIMVEMEMLQVTQAVVVAAVVWCVVFKATRYVSVASLAAAFMLPVSTLVTRVIVAPVTRPTAVLLAVIAILVIVRHRTNIARLVAGQENRFPNRPTGRILQR